MTTGENNQTHFNSTMQIPFFSFDKINKDCETEMYNAFQRVYQSKWYILGNEVSTFEKQYAEFNQTEYCAGISNGLDALHIALRTLKIGAGDEVLVPSNTYIATVLAILNVGATPVFIEPCFDTFNINPKEIIPKINSKTRAIMPVHLYGQCCEMDEIMEIAIAHNLFVIEDNAQSQGASYNGKFAGSFGNINATSFYPGKNIGALGDAGAITTNDERLYAKAKTLRNYGSQRKYYNEVIGYNMRLDELQAAFLNEKIAFLKEWNNERMKIAAYYIQNLKNNAEIVLPKTAKNATHVYHQFVIRCNKRDALQKYLHENGISTLIHYPIPPHLQEALSFLNHKKGDFPIAEKMADSCLSLPIYPGLTTEQQDYIMHTINKFNFV